MVLPPGYETHFFCPKDYCLRDRERPKKFLGPKSSFKECYNPLTNMSIPVTSWGPKKGESVKAKLIENGYHSNVCIKRKE